MFVWLTYVGYVKFPDDGTPGDLRVTSLLVSTFLSPSLKKRKKNQKQHTITIKFPVNTFKIKRTTSLVNSFSLCQLFVLEKSHFNMDDEGHHREINVISHKTELGYNFQPSEWLTAVQPPLTHYFERVASLFPACFQRTGAARPVEGGKGASRPPSFQMWGSENRDEGARGCRRSAHCLKAIE